MKLNYDSRINASTGGNMFCSCKILFFNDAVNQSTKRIHIGGKIVGNVELSCSIITWHKMVANKWRNTIEGATVTIGATLVDGATLKIGELCTCRRRNSEDWRTTMPTLLEPSSNSIDSTGIEKQLRYVACSSEVRSLWKTHSTQLAITTYWN